MFGIIPMSYLPDTNLQADILPLNLLSLGFIGRGIILLKAWV